MNIIRTAKNIIKYNHHMRHLLYKFGLFSCHSVACSYA